ncbi:MAG: bacteriohopanetetrol glucosamine biosynthesis glycosyltransferase HpnI [Microcystaceae cyanobacterium]
MIGELIGGLLLLLSLVSTGYYCYAIYASIHFFSEFTEVDFTFSPPITLLRPLCGSYEGMYAILASCCQQNYPSYQVIFTVQHPKDSAIPIVRQLQQNFSHLDITLVISDCVIGENLKVSNLANGIKQAKHDILVFMDGDIRVNPNYLQQIIQPLKQNSNSIVTCLYRSKTDNFISAFEALGIVTHFHPSVLVARLVEGIQYGFGSTIVIRHSILEKIGGLKSIANCLADDYKLANLAHQAGYPIVLSSQIVEHYLDTKSWSELIQRQSRWLRCIRVERFWSYVGLSITYGFVFGIVLVILFQNNFLSWLILTILLTLRLILAWLVGIYYFQDAAATKWFWLVPLRDILGMIIWGYSLFDNTVIWHSERFTLIDNGKMMQIRDNSSIDN